MRGETEQAEELEASDPVGNEGARGKKLDQDELLEILMVTQRSLARLRGELEGVKTALNTVFDHQDFVCDVVARAILRVSRDVR